MAPHILVFPYPAQGHMLPLLDLTHQLCLRGLSVTVVVTPKNLPFLSPLLSAHPSSASPLLLPFPPHPNLPSGVEHVQDIGNSGNFPIIAALSRLRHPILRWFDSHPSPPSAIVSDFFLGWTQDLANQIGVPRIAFYSSGAYLTSVVDHCWNNMDSVRSFPVVQFSDLPGSPSYRAEQLPSIFRMYRDSDPDCEIARRGSLANMESWGLVFNTFHALEGEYLDHIKTRAGHDRVFGVGPLVLTGTNREAGPLTNIMAWLDGCPGGSVLYVCFGSQKSLGDDQIRALASGLERSGTRFVWVMKGAAPGGFEERVAGRGVVVKGWAPQVSILNHEAVGGFLSHCGWNSVNEGVLGGVVILCWPMEADQFVNARLLAEDMGVAVRVCEGAGTVPDPEELGKTIAEFVHENAPQKAKAKELRDKALAAVRRGGTSAVDLDELVRQLQLLKRH